MDFNFLKNVKAQKLSHNPDPNTNTASNGVSVANMTEGASIRVYANGRVGFIPEFVTKHKLQFTSKGGETHRQGIDIVPSWLLKQLPIEQKVLFVSFVQGDQRRISMLGSCKYNEDGSPKGDANKGTMNILLRNYVLELEDVDVPTVPIDAKEIPEYNKEVTEIFKNHFGAYVDIMVHTDMVLFEDIDVWYFPKLVMKGANKGKMTAVRRDHAKLYPIEIVYRDKVEEEVLEEKVTEETVEEELGEETQDQATDLQGEADELGEFGFA